MYGDPTRLRADAAALARTGEHLTGQAERFVRSADETTWQSSAADAMRRQVHDDAGLLHTVSVEFADAAAAVLRHAAAVESAQDQIRALEHAVHVAAALAVTAAADLVGVPRAG